MPLVPSVTRREPSRLLARALTASPAPQGRAGLAPTSTESAPLEATAPPERCRQRPALPRPTPPHSSTATAWSAHLETGAQAASTKRLALRDTTAIRDQTRQRPQMAPRAMYVQQTPSARLARALPQAATMASIRMLPLSQLARPAPSVCTAKTVASSSLASPITTVMATRPTHTESCARTDSTEQRPALAGVTRRIALPASTRNSAREDISWVTVPQATSA